MSRQRGRVRCRASRARQDPKETAYARDRQKGGARTGRFLAPSSRLGLRLRNTALSRPRILARMLEAAKDATALALPDYPDHPVNSPSPQAS
ncbi:hypothetical protein ACXNSR_01875 [Streptomyces sp. NC-S4]